MEKKLTFRLSPSALNLFKECKRCFWLTQHRIWKRPAGIFSSLPSGIDKCLKQHFDKFALRKQLPPELRLLDGYSLCEDKDLLKLHWKDAQGNIFTGILDYLLIKGKKLIILDFKTRGYALREDTASFYQNQLDTYAFLLRQKNLPVEDYGYLVFYIPQLIEEETGAFVFTPEIVKMQLHPENAENLFAEALDFLQKECPEESCVWCEKR